jgi:large repetitive protein
VSVGLPGAAITSSGSAVGLTARVDWGDSSPVEDGVVQAAGNALVLANTHRYRDDGTYTTTVTAADGATTASDTLDVTVANAAPALDQQPGWSGDGGSAVAVLLPFTDPGVADTHTARIDWATAHRLRTARSQRPTAPARSPPATPTRTTGPAP